MIYKPYGQTGLSVSAVGFGGMRFDTSLPKEKNAELLHYARSVGVTYFDTAPGYCEDQSEDIFGIALRDLEPGYVVSTKGQPQQFPTAEKARDGVRRSLDRLGVPKINFYHIWCLRKMEHYELAMKPGGQYDGLLQCKEEGLIDNIVCSSHQPGHEIAKIVADGKVEGVLMGMNILNFPYRWDGADAAYKAGVGVVAMNPLGGGLIPQNEDKLGFLADAGETPSEAALRFIIGVPQISVALVGFTTTAHIDMACAAADACRPFTEADLQRVREHIGSNLNASCTACGYCKGCPQDIHIPAYMQLYNQHQVFGMDDAGMRGSIKVEREWGVLAASKGYAKDCIECGQCEDACTQHLPIIERLKEMAEWESEA